MQPGAVVADRFEIHSEAGHGGMGTVYRARDRTTGTLVALKLVSERAGDAFEAEARMLQELDHPGIVRYVAHGRAQEGTYLVMEWLDGEDLEQRISREALTLEQSVDVVRRAAEALGAAHTHGIVHRDVKPANLWLVGGDLAHVKILDFGVARARTTTLETMTGIVVGTPAYMAPEQVRGASSLDARADVYSLGCVLFECLTGRTPFVADDLVAVLAKTLLEEAPRLRSAMPTAPRELDDLVARMLAKEPSKRPASAEALVREPAFTSTAPPSVTRSIPPPPSAITAGEQRLASVILFGVTHVSAATVDNASWRDSIASARAVVETFGARIEVMIGGSVAVLVEGKGHATDEAKRAAACALALKRATGVTSMALATGRAELGLVPIGQAVERAATLLRDARPGVRVDDVTAALLGDEFDIGRGVLLGRRDTDEARTLLGKRTPTFGRTNELERLAAAFTRSASESRASATMVVAAAGMGKSRVRHEMLRALRGQKERPEVWMARGNPVAAGSAFRLASELVRRAAAALEGEPREVTHDKIARRVALRVPERDRARVSCFLCEMIGAPIAADDDVVLQTARREPMVMFDQIRLAWEDFVGAECAKRPLVIVLDDLHWGDRPTITLCDSALRLFHNRPLVIVAFARPEVTERFPDLWAERELDTIALGALPRQAASALVAHALGAKATPEATARLVERASGNAFYLEELVRALAEGRSETPESALLMVQSRLEALEPEARRVLRAASVFGRAFWEGGVSALVASDEEATRWLAVLEERELVHRHGTSQFSGQRELMFDHALVQEAAHAMLTGADLALGHKLAATWLESAGETDAMVLAEHWEAGGEKIPARAAWTRAAEQALEGNDYASCIARATRGVACGANGIDLARLRDLQAEAHRWLGENSEMATRAREAMTLLPRASDAWAEAASKLALACQRLGRAAEMPAIAEELALVMTTHARVSAGARTASALALAGKRAEANWLLELVERAAATITDPAMLARVDQGRANRALFEGRAAEYVERSMSAANEFAAAGDRRLACVATLNVGHGLLELGVPDAVSTLEEAAADAERLGLRNIASAAMQNLGWALFRANRADEALEVLATSVVGFASQGNRRLEGFSHVYVARILLERGDLDRAHAAAERGLALSESALPLRVSALAVTAAIHMCAGRHVDAVMAAREALVGLEIHGVEEGEGFIRLACAEALAAASMRDEASRAVSHAHARLLERAAAIHKSEWRACFERVPEHARTLKMASAST